MVKYIYDSLLKNLDKVPGNSNPVIVCISHSASFPKMSRLESLVMIDLYRHTQGTRFKRQSTQFKRGLGDILKLYNADVLSCCQRNLNFPL